MKFTRTFFLILIWVIAVGPLLNSCFSDHKGGLDEAAYIQSVKKWQRERVAYQKGHNGWLNLAGLFWLQEGENNVGSGDSMDIRFPVTAPSFTGTFVLKSKKVTFKTAPDANVKENNIPVDSVEMIPDVTMHPTILSLDSLQWFIIKRADRFGIRLRDFNRPEIAHLDSIPCFPIALKWRVKARLKKYESKHTLQIANVIGQLSEEETPGVLEFEWGGEKYHLTPLGSPGELWLIFADETSGDQTYGAGRFLEIDPPAKDGTYILDFNKAYNPPCAFTSFATCPLPPKENFLQIAVLAGERSVHH